MQAKRDCTKVKVERTGKGNYTVVAFGLDCKVLGSGKLTNLGCVLSATSYFRIVEKGKFSSQLRQSLDGVGIR